MCLAIPMHVDRVDGMVAQCSARGITREVGLLFLLGDEPEPGEYVIVNLGQAVQRVSTEEAKETWALLDQLPGTGSPGSATGGTPE
jgi:hydrogenase expression/formation protein HypC